MKANSAENKTGHGLFFVFFFLYWIKLSLFVMLYVCYVEQSFSF